MTADAALDTGEHLNAFIELLQAAIRSPHVYELGAVPGTRGVPGVLPPTYVALGVYRVPVDTTSRRWSAETDQTAWELELSHAGSTIREAGEVYRRVSVALDDQTIAIGQEPVGPIEFVSDELPELDESRWIGRSTWAYGL